MSSSGANESTDGSSMTVETEWLWFGIALAIAHLVFLVLIIGLLQIDVVLALITAVVVSTVGGIATVAYVLWWK